MKFSIGVVVAALYLSSSTSVKADGILGSFFGGSGGGSKETGGKVNAQEVPPQGQAQGQKGGAAGTGSLQETRRVKSNRVMNRDLSSSSQRHGRQLVVDNQNHNVDLSNAVPSQTFYIPMPETDIFDDLLRDINGNQNNNGDYYVRGDMISLISVAISTKHTVIWYDHGEDGYETNVRQPTSPHTEIWGDGNKNNGCRPDIPIMECQDADDIFHAGDSFVIENNVPVPRTSTNWHVAGIKHDGGDKVYASFPITMTRGEYAEYPGSLLAGAVEILDTDHWGTQFVSPIGTDTNVLDTSAFEITRLFIMSSRNGNHITLPNGQSTTLNEGQSISVSVQQGNTIHSDHPIQVDICTGDRGSTYELRWFSLLPTTAWKAEYMSPVGDSYGRTKLVMYNPNTSNIDVRFEWRKDNGSIDSENYTIEPNKVAKSRIVPTGSGAIVKEMSAGGGKPFIALSITDSEKHVGVDQDIEYLGGMAFDWGFPAQPVDALTPQVLVGWGYGCTANDCEGKTERSAVWISPVDDADIYIDYQNIGENYEKIEDVEKLQSIMIRDTDDHDMSGAVIFATVPGSGPTGLPVDIASAWGQDPSVSRPDQRLSLDLGTVVLPFTTLRVNKVVDLQQAQPGQTLMYTITVQNVGQTEVKAGDYSIHDPTMFQGEYIEDSTMYSADGGSTYFYVPDDLVGVTPFPLDEAGLPSLRDLPRRGGVHKIQFRVFLEPSKVTSDELINEGYITPPNGPNLPFEATTRIGFHPSIRVDNVVYKGDLGEVGCNMGKNNVTDVHQTEVTYCFNIINNGFTYLKDIQLTNTQLNIQDDHFSDIPQLLAPGGTHLVTYKSSINGDLRNQVRVEGNPAFHSNAEIPGLGNVAATDPSRVFMVDFTAAVKLANTVYKGRFGQSACKFAGRELATGALGAEVTYCFNITNIGSSHLTNIRLEDPQLFDNVPRDIIDLEPGKSALVIYESTITASLPNPRPNPLENLANVTGTPVTANGDPIPSLKDVSNSDPSEIGQGIDTQAKSGNKTAYTPPEACMQTNWEDAGNNQTLICRKKEVYIDKDKVTSPTRITCDENDMVTVNLNASIHFNTARYDIGWYVGKDGGDALLGECAINGLTPDHTYKVTSGYQICGQKTTDDCSKTGSSHSADDADDDCSGVEQKDEIVGLVKWNDDEEGGNDVCGDIFVDGGGGGNIMVPLVVNEEMKCVDHNNDGNMDLSVCFSWRDPGKDGHCTLTRNDNETSGSEADLYPANPIECFCARYDIREITVRKPTDDQHTSPC